MKAYIVILLATCMLFGGCYRRSTLDPNFTKIESDFERNSIRALSPPMCLSVQLNDSREDIGEYLPNMSTASLESANKEKFLLNFERKNFQYTSKEDRAKWGRKEFWATFYFEIMDPSFPSRKLNNLPDGVYKFSVEFVCPEGKKRFSATIKRRTRFEAIQGWDH